MIFAPSGHLGIKKCIRVWLIEINIVEDRKIRRSAYGKSAIQRFIESGESAIGVKGGEK
jgi:hypothetical protein